MRKGDYVPPEVANAGATQARFFDVLRASRCGLRATPLAEWGPLWLLILLPVLASCGGGSSDDADADTDTDIDSDVDTDSDTDGGVCKSDPFAAGCPCDALGPAQCYEGPPSTEDVGTCRAGLRTCLGGVWSECEGQVLPSDEVCDYEDSDCDGEADEGLLSECGTCGECDCVGRDCPDPFDPDDGEGVVSCGDEPDGECLSLPAAPGTGSWTRVFSPCRGIGGIDWLSIEFDADVPVGAFLAFEARAADTFDDLSAEPWTPVGAVPPDSSPIDLPDGFDDRSLLEVRVGLTATGDVAPRIHRVGVVISCAM